jgi:hypothetical protein
MWRDDLQAFSQTSHTAFSKFCLILKFFCLKILVDHKQTFFLCSLTIRWKDILEKKVMKELTSSATNSDPVILYFDPLILNGFFHV